MIRGLFADSLPSFLNEHKDNVSYLHIDCDLYSSTKTVFDNLGDRICAGTIIVFDEYFNYPGWRDGEYKAFQEFVAQSGITYEYIGYVPTFQQVAVRVL